MNITVSVLLKIEITQTSKIKEKKIFYQKLKTGY